MTNIQLSFTLRRIEGALGLPEGSITGRSQQWRISTPRHFVAYELRRQLAWSYAAIGVALGGRDHSTIMHGCDAAESMLYTRHPAARHYPLIRDLIAMFRGHREHPGYLPTIILPRGPGALPRTGGMRHVLV